MSEPNLAAAVIGELTTRELTVATAESLTGGLLAARLTQVPGASASVLGGVVSYATEVKVRVLGVPRQLVEEVGVVSAECARAMAAGVRDLLEADLALATTGVAGPTGQEGKPVGTVYLGIASAEGTRAVRLALDGDREQIRTRTVDEALALLLAVLRNRPPSETSPGGEETTLG